MGFLSKTNIAGQMISRVITALKYDNSLYFDHILFDEIVHIDLKNRWYLWISNISLEHRKIALHRKIAYMFQCHTFAPSPLSLSPKNASFTSKEVGKEWSKAQSDGLELLQTKKEYTWEVYLNLSLAPCGSLEISYSTLCRINIILIYQQF